LKQTTLKILVLSALLSAGFLAAFFGGGILNSSTALAQGNQGAGNCLGSDATKTPDDPGDIVILTAPAGQVITTVAIKAGTPCVVFTADGSNGCYTVEGIGTPSVTVTRIGSGPTCKEISHIEFLTSTAPPPTTTETIPTTTTG
jgi:hypothetical protein